jgi:hypothetical protein
MCLEQTNFLDLRVLIVHFNSVINWKHSMLCVFGKKLENFHKVELKIDPFGVLSGF